MYNAEAAQTKKPIRLLVAGHSGHGKDEVCTLLSELSHGKIKYESSSIALIEEGIFDDYIKAHFFETFYESGIEAARSQFYVERDPHRVYMYNRINEFCVKGTETAELIFSKGNTVYCGMRNLRELQACDAAGLFDLKLWVDASGRKPLESLGSNSISAYDCDLTLDNNGTLAQLKDRCERLVELIAKL